MKQNKKYSVDELLNNDDFIAWVTTGNKFNNFYWAKIKQDLVGVDKSNFDKSENIIQKIKTLNIDHVDIKTPEFIQKQYIRLLEANAIKQKEQRKVFSLNQFLRIAAAIILLISLSGIFYYNNTSSKNTFQEHLARTNYNKSEILLQTSGDDFFKITDDISNNWLTNNGVFISVDGNNIKFVATDDVDQELVGDFKLIVPEGEKYHITMVDGSEVELNENSTLTFNNSMVSKNRIVALTGEAFFDIAHNSDRPFIVQSSDLQIEVLGTEFNVSNYKENKFLRTTLIDGSVKIIHANGDKAVIKPGEQATVYFNQNDINVQQADVQETVAWMSGRLIFSGDKFENLITRLNQWYGVNFILIGDDIKAMKFTGTLKKENDLIYFLQMLKYTKGVDYEIDNDQVKLFVK